MESIKMTVGHLGQRDGSLVLFLRKNNIFGTREPSPCPKRGDDTVYEKVWRSNMQI